MNCHYTGSYSACNIPSNEGCHRSKVPYQVAGTASRRGRIERSRGCRYDATSLTSQLCV